MILLSPILFLYILLFYYSTANIFPIYNLNSYKMLFTGNFIFHIMIYKYSDNQFYQIWYRRQKSRQEIKEQKKEDDIINIQNKHKLVKINMQYNCIQEPIINNENMQKILITKENRQYTIIPSTGYFDGTSTIKSRLIDTIDFQFDLQRNKYLPKQIQLELKLIYRTGKINQKLYTFNFNQFNTVRKGVKEKILKVLQRLYSLQCSITAKSNGTDSPFFNHPIGALQRVKSEKKFERMAGQTNQMNKKRYYKNKSPQPIIKYTIDQNIKITRTQEPIQNSPFTQTSIHQQHEKKIVKEKLELQDEQKEQSSSFNERNKIFTQRIKKSIEMHQYPIKAINSGMNDRNRVLILQNSVTDLNHELKRQKQNSYRLQKQINNLKNKIQHLNHQKQLINRQKIEVKQIYEHKQKQQRIKYKRDIDNLRRQYEGIINQKQKQITKLTIQLKQTYTASINNLNRANQTQSKSQQLSKFLNKKITQLQKQLHHKNQIIHSRNQRINQLIKSIDHQSNIIQNFDTTTNHYQNQINNLQHQIQSLNRKIIHLQNQNYQFKEEIKIRDQIINTKQQQIQIKQKQIINKSQQLYHKQQQLIKSQHQLIKSQQQLAHPIQYSKTSHIVYKQEYQLNNQPHHNNQQNHNYDSNPQNQQLMELVQKQTKTYHQMIQKLQSNIFKLQSQLKIMENSHLKTTLQLDNKIQQLNNSHNMINNLKQKIKTLQQQLTSQKIKVAQIKTLLSQFNSTQSSLRDKLQKEKKSIRYRSYSLGSLNPGGQTVKIKTTQRYRLVYQPIESIIYVPPITVTNESIKIQSIPSKKQQLYGKNYNQYNNIVQPTNIMNNTGSSFSSPYLSYPNGYFGIPLNSEQINRTNKSNMKNNKGQYSPQRKSNISRGQNDNKSRSRRSIFMNSSMQNNYQDANSFIEKNKQNYIVQKDEYVVQDYEDSYINQDGDYVKQKRKIILKKLD